MITKSRAPEPANWLLLLHQLPAKPAYARVKLWRRLQALGAVAVKNAVYALPAGAQAQEDFEWALKEIIAAGGEGMIVEARLIDGLSDEGVRALFNAAREADYRALAKEIRALEKDAAPAPVARLRAEAARITAIDFFGANGREDVEARLAARSVSDTGSARGTRSLVSGSGHVWVTRRDVHVDRIGSAWLIRRFIDPTGVVQVCCREGLSSPAGRASFRYVRSRVHPRGRSLHVRGAAAEKRQATTPHWRRSARSCTTSTSRTASSRAPRREALPR